MQTIQVIVKRYLWWITSVGVKGDLNDAESRVVTGDIFAANGLIHAIDEVLLPNLPSSSPPPTPSPSQCKTVQTLDEFEIEQYISKKWYSQQQRPVQFNSEALFYCITAEYSFLDSTDDPLAITNGFDVKVFNKGQDVDGNIFTSDDEFAEGGVPVPSGLCAGQKVFDGDKDSELTVGFCSISVFAFGPSNYWVLAYDEEEGAALIAGGQPDTPNSNGDGLCTYSDPISGLWIFTRSPVRNETLIEKYRGIAIDNGIDPSMMKDVAQEDCAYSPSAEPSAIPSLRATLSPVSLPSSSPITLPTHSPSSSPSQSPTSPSSSNPTRPSFFSFTDSPTSFFFSTTGSTDEPTPNSSDTSEPTPNLSDSNEPSSSSNIFGV